MLTPRQRLTAYLAVSMILAVAERLRRGER